MEKLKCNLAAIALFVFCAASLTGACGGGQQPAIADRAASDLPTAAPLAADDKATERTVRFLEERVKSDPEDFSAHGKLAGLYLQKLRETGNASYLELACRQIPAACARNKSVVRHFTG